MKDSKQALRYALIKESKKLIIFFKMDNPVQRELASMMVRELKAYMRKVGQTNLVGMEMAITNALIAEYEKYLQKGEGIADAKNKRRLKGGDESSSDIEKEKSSDDIGKLGKGIKINKIFRNKSSSRVDKGKSLRINKGSRRRIRSRQK